MIDEEVEREYADVRGDGEAIIDIIDDAIFIVDEEWQIVYANSHACEQAGRSLDELREAPVMELVDTLVIDGETRFEDALTAVFDGREPFPKTITLELDLPGGRAFKQYKLKPIEGDSGELRAVVTVRDVTEMIEQRTERERRERQLSRLHEVTSELLDATTIQEAAHTASSAADDILDFSFNGVHRYDDAIEGLVPVVVSESSQKQLGDVPTLDKGLAWEAFERGETTVYDDLTGEKDVYNPETVMRSEVYVPLGEFGVFIVSAREAGAFDRTDVELLELLTANTETALQRIQRENQLLDQKTALETQNERLDGFASLVSHDLRNPLNVASLRLELLEQEHESEHTEPLSRALDRMERLIDELLMLAREGETIGAIDAVDLAQAVEDAWNHVETSSATLELDCATTIRADRSRLKQLLANLFSNAVEHGGEQVTVRVGQLDDGFYVEDDGKGVPESKRENVFEPGYSTATDGTGFGLDIVSRIVSGHDWEIDLTASEAGGARFEISGVDRLN